MKRLDPKIGRSLWEKEFRRLNRKRKECGHDRLAMKIPCAVVKDKKQCMYQWGTTRFLVLTGCISGLLKELDDYAIVRQHLKLAIDYKVPDELVEGVCKTVGSSTYVGLYLGHENSDQSAFDIFDGIVKIVTCQME